MTEEVKKEEVPPKPKQYLLMADEVTMILMNKIMPGLLFIQVEGMAIQGNNEHMLLVNPIIKPAPAETVPVQGVTT